MKDEILARTWDDCVAGHHRFKIERLAGERQQSQFNSGARADASVANSALNVTPDCRLISNLTYSFIKDNIFDLVSPVKHSNHSAASSVERNVTMARTGRFCLPLYTL